MKINMSLNERTDSSLHSATNLSLNRTGKIFKNRRQLRCK